MSDLDLDAIEARANAATPGWREWQGAVVNDEDDVVAEVAFPDDLGRADLAFIVHARQDVPDLVAEVRRLRAENERLSAQDEAGPE